METRMRPRSALAWFVLGLSCLFAQSLGAAEIRFGSMVPGAGVIRKPVTSMREQRFVNLVPQQTDFSCGAAAVATILKYAYSRPVGEREVLEGMLEIADRATVLSKGFSLLDMKAYVESVGMQGIGFRIKPENLYRIKIPTIVLLDIKGYKHFVVLKKAKVDRVYLADPALGNNIMPIDKFIASWNGIIFAMVTKEGYDENTVLAQASEPLSVRTLLKQRAPILRADVLDFGMIHADLFRF